MKNYYDFQLRKKNLLWTNNKFVYLIFIGQTISYFRHYVHLQKSPGDMNKSKDMNKFKQDLILNFSC